MNFIKRNFVKALLMTTGLFGMGAIANDVHAQNNPKAKQDTTQKAGGRTTVTFGADTAKKGAKVSVKNSVVVEQSIGGQQKVAAPKAAPVAPNVKSSQTLPNVGSPTPQKAKPKVTTGGKKKKRTVLTKPVNKTPPKAAPVLTDEQKNAAKLNNLGKTVTNLNAKVTQLSKNDANLQAGLNKTNQGLDTLKKNIDSLTNKISVGFEELKNYVQMKQNVIVNTDVNVTMPAAPAVKLDTPATPLTEFSIGPSFHESRGPTEEMLPGVTAALAIQLAAKGVGKYVKAKLEVTAQKPTTAKLLSQQGCDGCVLAFDYNSGKKVAITADAGLVISNDFYLTKAIMLRPYLGFGGRYINNTVGEVNSNVLLHTIDPKLENKTATVAALKRPAPDQLKVPQFGAYGDLGIQLAYGLGGNNKKNLNNKTMNVDKGWFLFADFKLTADSFKEMYKNPSRPDKPGVYSDASINGNKIQKRAFIGAKYVF